MPSSGRNISRKCDRSRVYLSSFAFDNQCSQGDLREEATLVTLRQSAQVHKVEPSNRLDTYVDVDARLRFWC